MYVRMSARARVCVWCISELVYYCELMNLQLSFFEQKLFSENLWVCCIAAQVENPFDVFLPFHK